MKQEIIMLVTAVIGTIGFSIIFYLPPKRIPLTAFGGLLACFFYILMMHVSDSEFVSNLIGALAAELYAQIFARICKCPSSIVTLPAVIPLIPGRMLYNTMSAIVRHDYALAGQYGTTTLEIVSGIAAGIAIGSVIVSFLTTASKRNPKKAKTSKKKKAD